MNIYLIKSHVYISHKKLSHLFTNFEHKKTSPKAGSYKLNSLEENYSHSNINEQKINLYNN